MTERIAFLGIGLMGAPMAGNLIAAGHSVVLWNRTRSKAEALAPLGGHVAESAAEAVRGTDLVITMLESGPVVETVLFGPQGAAAALRPGTLVIDMSSIPPATARDHADRLRARGATHLDAPVSGGTVGAREGTLAIMVGGALQDFTRAQPILERLGRPTLVGPSGSGALAKLCNQAIVAITIGAVSEALLCASPDYIKRHGAPEELEDISRHSCLNFSYEQLRHQWPIKGPDGTMINIPVTGKVVSNNGDLLRHCAIAGMGITIRPSFALGDDLAAGRLVRLLPEFELGQLPVMLVYPSRRLLSAKVRTFVDFMSKQFPHPEHDPWQTT